MFKLYIFLGMHYSTASKNREEIWVSLNEKKNVRAPKENSSIMNEGVMTSTTGNVSLRKRQQR